MAAKNYYHLLGVSHTETARGIQKAFRALAQHHHPDRAGPQSVAHFQELVEAYRTLAEPQRRRDYDAQLHQADHTRRQSPAPPYADAWPRPEPLIPQPLSVHHDFATVRSSWEALHDRLLRNFTGRGIPKGEERTSLTVEVQLSPDEAQRGGVLYIGVPVFHACTFCAGTGRDWGWPCQACLGQGMIEDEDVVAVHVPAHVPQGTVVDVPLRGLRIENFYLRVYIRVTSWL